MRAGTQTHAPDGAPYSLSARWLLWPYACLPVAILLVALDQLWLEGQLRRHLPRDPHQIFAIDILFGLPHVLMSGCMLLAYADYRRHFRSLILWGIALALVPALMLRVPELLTPGAAIIGVWTAMHLVRQQTGLATALAGVRGSWHRAWAWSAVGVAAPAYFLALSGPALAPMLARSLQWICGLSWGVLLLCCIVLLRRVWRQPGGAFVAWTSGTFVAIVPFLAAGYPFLAVLVPRFLHDTCAFTVYGGHELGRAQQGRALPLYNWTRRLRIPLVLVLPALGIAGGYLIRWGIPEWVYGVSRVGHHDIFAVHALWTFHIFATLHHYWMEAFTWRRDSPYRHAFRLTHPAT